MDGVVGDRSLGNLYILPAGFWSGADLSALYSGGRCSSDWYQLSGDSGNRPDADVCGIINGRGVAGVGKDDVLFGDYDCVYGGADSAGYSADGNGAGAGWHLVGAYRDEYHKGRDLCDILFMGTKKIVRNRGEEA